MAAATKRKIASAVVGRGDKTPRERILLQPQDYIGSVDKCTRKMWVFEGRSMSMTHRVITYVPGLYKIFDEVLVYAADNQQRDPSMDSLDVEIDAADCRISIYHRGQGVPIERHPKDGVVYMPEMVFGDLSNCDEEIAGGRNRYGVKLANLFSTEFIIETVDSRRRLEKKYKQVFSENMGKKSEPEITRSLLGVNWTRITFKPDLAKFNMTHLDDDIVALMMKRVVDMIIAGIVRICRKHFQVEESEVKRHLWVFVNAVIDNPSFDSPTRDALITPQENFDSSCELSDQFLSNALKCICASSACYLPEKKMAHQRKKASV